MNEGDDKLERIVSTVTDGIVVVDERGVVLFANQSAKTIFGDRPLLGRNLGIPVAPRDGFQDVQIVRQGKVGWAELRSAPIEWDGKAATIGSFRDITERRKAEDALSLLNTELEARVRQRTEALEEANRELESFAYSVSHDLRSPLRAIDGFGRILELDHGDRLDGEGLQQLHLIRDSAKRMGELIDDLLEFSRMGRQEMRLKPLDMTGLVKEAIRNLMVAEPGRTIDFVVQPLPPAQGDGSLLSQVWINLLANSVKFTRNCPDPRIEIGGQEDGSEVLFWVRDNGAGFDMHYADKLFGVFQRLHRQSEFEGTGVGLAIARRIVARHGGRIWGESSPGEGATFWFTLPRAAGAG